MTSCFFQLGFSTIFVAIQACYKHFTGKNIDPKTEQTLKDFAKYLNSKETDESGIYNIILRLKLQLLV